MNKVKYKFLLLIMIAGSKTADMQAMKEKVSSSLSDVKRMAKRVFHNEKTFTVVTSPVMGFASGVGFGTITSFALMRYGASYAITHAMSRYSLMTNSNKHIIIPAAVISMTFVALFACQALAVGVVAQKITAMSITLFSPDKVTRECLVCRFSSMQSNGSTQGARDAGIDFATHSGNMGVVSRRIAICYGHFLVGGFTGGLAFGAIMAAKVHK